MPSSPITNHLRYLKPCPNACNLASHQNDNHDYVLLLRTDYHSYGFAVFKLKPGAMTVHPMAFSFPRRDPNALFFPTVHIHDGKVHSRAGFDHVLYCQPHENEYPTFGGRWEESSRPAKSFMNLDKSKGVIEPEQHCYKRALRGQLPNRDTVLKIAG